MRTAALPAACVSCTGVPRQPPRAQTFSGGCRRSRATTSRIATSGPSRFVSCLIFGIMIAGRTRGETPRLESKSQGSASPVIQHPLRIRRPNASHLPEVPSGGRPRQLSHGNQAVRRGLLQSALPARDHHRRALQVLSELELVQSKLFPQCSNPPRPCWQGCGHELSRPGHICLQDNKLTLYCETHTKTPLPATEVSPRNLLCSLGGLTNPAYLTYVLIDLRHSLPWMLI